MSQKNRRFEPAGKKIKKNHSKRVVFLTMVMRFPIIANWSKPPQTFAYKHFEEGRDFCESTDFLLEALFSYLELV